MGPSPYKAQINKWKKKKLPLLISLTPQALVILVVRIFRIPTYVPELRNKSRGCLKAQTSHFEAQLYNAYICPGQKYLKVGLYLPCLQCASQLTPQIFIAMRSLNIESWKSSRFLQWKQWSNTPCHSFGGNCPQTDIFLSVGSHWFVTFRDCQPSVRNHMGSDLTCLAQ